jgi:hypothetical protein
MLKRLSISILLSLIFLAALAYPIYASNPFWRVLDTSGAGTGTSNATGNYTTSTRFFLKPSSTVILNRLIVNVEDSAVITYNLYGSATITNGVIIRKWTPASLITMTGAITNNFQWGRYCTVTKTTGQSVNQLQAVCELDGIEVLPSERFEVVLNDDFSGLDGHRFIVEGYTP